MFLRITGMYSFDAVSRGPAGLLLTTVQGAECSFFGIFEMIKISMTVAFSALIRGHALVCYCLTHVSETAGNLHVNGMCAMQAIARGKLEELVTLKY